MVLASNFTAGFPKLGYTAIKKIFDLNNIIRYGQHNLIQAADLKNKLEELGLKQNGATLASIDAKMMYPSSKFGLIEKAIDFYSAKLDNDEDKETITVCLQLINFGMENMLLTFIDKY